jgi:hypothetical protein
MKGARDLGGLLLGVVVNGLLLYGVVVLGWSPGSMFLLFPVGSIGLGVVGHDLTTAMMPVVVLLVAKAVIEVVALTGVFVGPRLVEKLFDAWGASD